MIVNRQIVTLQCLYSKNTKSERKLGSPEDMFSHDVAHVLYLYFQIVKRGAAPEGGGEVLFTCPCRQKLRPLHFLDPGKIKRIRGVAYPLSEKSHLLEKNFKLVVF